MQTDLPVPGTCTPSLHPWDSRPQAGSIQDRNTARVTGWLFLPERPALLAWSFIYEALDAEESALEPSPLFSSQCFS